MGLPSWSQSRTQPIAIEDVVRSIELCLKHPNLYVGSFDIGGPDILTYRKLIELTAEEMGRRRLLIPMPVISVVFQSGGWPHSAPVR